MESDPNLDENLDVLRQIVLNYLAEKKRSDTAMYSRSVELQLDNSSLY